MPPNRPARLVFILIVAITLVLIGRNLYRHHINHALVSAIKTRDVPAVRRLLEQGADPNYRFSDASEDERPQTPESMLDLVFSIDAQPVGIGYEAIHTSATEIVQLLLSHGAHWQGAHALEWACRLGDVVVARQLLARGDDPTAPVNAGALSEAIGYADSFHPDIPIGRLPSAAENEAARVETAHRQEVSRQLVQMLREHGAQLSLTQAQAVGDMATVRKLLASGGRGLAQEGFSALTRAALDGDLKTILQLLKQGVDPNRPPQASLQTTIPGAVAYYETPLHAAASKDHIEAVRLLLAHGADPNPADPSRNSPLPAAIYAGDLDMVKLLLAHGAKTSDGSSYPPLIMAIFSKHPTIVRYLLEQGVGRAETPGAEPVLSAALASLPEVVPDLLRHGASVNLLPPPGNDPTTREQSFFSPLTAAIWCAPQYESTLVKAGAKIGPDRAFVCAAAVQQKRLDLLPKLLAYGADINGVDENHDPALSICVQSAPESVKILLEHGANPNVLSHSRETPLAAAARIGNIDLVRLLLAHGAAVNAHVEHAHTALYWARKKNRADMVMLLQQAGAKE